MSPTPWGLLPVFTVRPSTCEGAPGSRKARAPPASAVAPSAVELRLPVTAQVPPFSAVPSAPPPVSRSAAWAVAYQFCHAAMSRTWKWWMRWESAGLALCTPG